MIELVGKPGDKDCKIRFTPRPGFKRKVQTIERELIYGHVCAKCMNVVQAMFLTEEMVDLWPYEETNVISVSQDIKKNGDLLKIVPNVGSKLGYTNYTVSKLRTSKAMGQHLALKNHILKYHGLDVQEHTSDRYLEPGERTCEYIGVFALREDLLIKDLCNFMRLDAKDILKYDLPSVADFMQIAVVNFDYRVLPAYGVAPPMIVFPREKLTDRYGHGYQMKNILSKFEKVVVPVVKGA